MGGNFRRRLLTVGRYREISTCERKCGPATARLRFMCTISTKASERFEEWTKHPLPLKKERSLKHAANRSLLLLLASCFVMVSFLVYSSNQKIEAIISSEMPFYLPLNTQSYIPEDRTLHNHPPWEPQIQLLGWSFIRCDLRAKPSSSTTCDCDWGKTEHNWRTGYGDMLYTKKNPSSDMLLLQPTLIAINLYWASTSAIKTAVVIL
jgi:hypothetical protein